MSVYRHFRDKEDLLDAVAAAGADVGDVPPAEGTWRDQLAGLAGQARTMLTRQPADLRRRTLASPGVISLREAAVRALEEAGHSSAAAGAAWRTVLAYVVGSTELEGAADTEPGTDGTSFDEGLERVLDGIAPR